MVLLLGACGRRTPTESAPRPAAPPAVEWACGGVVRTGPRCELGPERKLTLWLPVTALTGWSFATDQGPLAPLPPVPVQGGSRLAFTVPAGVKEARVTAPDGGRWSLALGDAAEHREVDELLAKGKSGDPKAVLPRLRQLADAADGPRGQAEAAYGRLQLALSNMTEAERALRRSMGIARDEGRLSDEMRDGAALIWGLVESQQRFNDARVVLATLGSKDQRYPEGLARLAYAQGMLAVWTGDVRGALASYRAAARDAERLGLLQLAADASQELARMLTSVGRAREGMRILDSMTQRAGDACARATLDVNRAWIAMEAAGEQSGSDDRVVGALEAARASTRECPDPHRRFLAAINAAEYALQVGDLDRVSSLVIELGDAPAPINALDASWRADVVGRWSLARGRHTAALTSFDEQAAIARAAGLAEETFRADVGAGRALLALGHRPQAAARFRHAQAHLERTLSGIPIAEGQREFLSGHDDAIRYLVDVLVASSAVEEALRVARLTRATQLAYASRLDRLNRLTPAERQKWDVAIERYARIRSALEREAEGDWKLSRSALDRARKDREQRVEDARSALDEAYKLLTAHGIQRPSPLDVATGEVELTIFPGAERWYSFARTAKGVIVRAFQADRLASMGAAGAVLEALGPALTGVHRARIFAYGKADGVDWHTVVWRGKPLIETIEVVYSADVGGVPPSSGPTAALIVANPTEDLPSAAAEADDVVRALRNWQVTRLDGRKAKREAVLSALANTTLFHYAGHAEVAGPSGTTSSLVLAGGARADLGDLLAVARVPDAVVLSACGAAGNDAAGGSLLGLAQAFVVSGAHAVIAPVRPVRDDEARAFIGAVYAALGGDGASGFPRAFRRACLDPRAGMAMGSFRAVVP